MINTTNLEVKPVPPSLTVHLLGNVVVEEAVAEGALVASRRGSWILVDTLHQIQPYYRWLLIVHQRRALLQYFKWICKHHDKQTNKLAS